MKYLAAALACSVLAVPTWAQTPEEVAAAALEAAPVWDGHNDLPIQLRARLNNQIADFHLHDTLDPHVGPASSQPLHTDLRRLRQGKVGAQFWSVYVSAQLPEPEAVQMTMEQIDVTKRLVARYSDDLAFALTADEVEAAVDSPGRRVATATPALSLAFTIDRRGLESQREWRMP